MVGELEFERPVLELKKKLPNLKNLRKVRTLIFLQKLRS